MRAKRSTPEAAIENCDPSQLAEEAETQVVMNKTKRQKFTKGLSTPGEHAGKSVGEHAGVIRSIVVENFMNHTHLRIDLDPHVNFIVGMNGSGKSAIVASLIAGLGEKASSTGRNTKGHASLIKHGCDSALIQIHLANEGKDAFKADEFPETVVVEHRLERAGGGGVRGQPVQPPPQREGVGADEQGGAPRDPDARVSLSRAARGRRLRRACGRGSCGGAAVTRSGERARAPVADTRALSEHEPFAP
mmetsp:Transcript_29963/g.65554  ORF Transcript_29963/g.65554 Transcript_29963/m.65554 type:complete len:247 (+) Transcript_29963:112-852(+)